jgi:hypothetical protein
LLVELIDQRIAKSSALPADDPEADADDIHFDSGAEEQAPAADVDPSEVVNALRSQPKGSRPKNGSSPGGAPGNQKSTAARSPWKPHQTFPQWWANQTQAVPPRGKPAGRREGGRGAR